MGARAAVAFTVAALVAACGLSRVGLGDGVDAGLPAGDASLLDTAPSVPDAGDEGDAGAVDAGPDDAPSALDAAESDAAPVEAAPCLGLTCNGACLPDASDCRACDGGPLLCAASGACAATCAACAQRPIQCFDCDSNRQNPVGTCEPFDAGSYCLNVGAYPGLHCACASKNDPTPCPGQTQVCGSISLLTIACMTCGEQGSDGLVCRGGGACVAATATCH